LKVSILGFDGVFPSNVLRISAEIIYNSKKKILSRVDNVIFLYRIRKEQRT
jgi:hypothetical protein